MRRHGLGDAWREGVGNRSEWLEHVAWEEHVQVEVKGKWGQSMWPMVKGNRSFCLMEDGAINLAKEHCWGGSHVYLIDFDTSKGSIIGS